MGKKVVKWIPKRDEAGATLGSVIRLFASGDSGGGAYNGELPTALKNAAWRHERSGKNVVFYSGLTSPDELHMWAGRTYKAAEIWFKETGAGDFEEYASSEGALNIPAMQDLVNRHWVDYQGPQIYKAGWVKSKTLFNSAYHGAGTTSPTKETLVEWRKYIKKQGPMVMPVMVYDARTSTQIGLPTWDDVVNWKNKKPAKPFAWLMLFPFSRFRKRKATGVIFATKVDPKADQALVKELIAIKTVQNEQKAAAITPEDEKKQSADEQAKVLKWAEVNKAWRAKKYDEAIALIGQWMLLPGVTAAAKADAKKTIAEIKADKANPAAAQKPDAGEGMAKSDSKPPTVNSAKEQDLKKADKGDAPATVSPPTSGPAGPGTPPTDLKFPGLSGGGAPTKKFTSRSSTPLEDLSSSKDGGHTTGTKANKKYNLTITLASIPTYIDVVTHALKQLNEKVKQYGIHLNVGSTGAPIDLGIQVDNLITFKNGIKSVVASIDSSAPPETVLHLQFDNKFNLLKFSIAAPGWKTKKSHLSLNSLKLSSPYNSKTCSSLIYNLVNIYNEYHTAWGVGEWYANEDEVRLFFRRFVYPKVHFINTKAGEYVVEKYILGDARLLDDEFFKKYKLKPEEISAQAKLRIRKKVGTQYEKIGDALGFAYHKGAFKEINDLDDFYEQVLNWIDIPEMMKIAVACLLKLVDVEALMDKICGDVLKRFDEVQEEVYGWLESSDDAFSRALKKELKDLMESGSKAYLNLVEGMITQGVEALTDLISNQLGLLTWRDPDSIKGLLNSTVQQCNQKNTMLWGKETAKILQLGETKPWNSLEAGFQEYGAGSLAEKIQTFEDRLAELETAVSTQAGREKSLGDLLPKNERGIASDFSAEVAKVETKLKKLLDAKKLAQEQTAIYRVLVEEIIPRAIALDPYIDSVERISALGWAKDALKGGYNKAPWSGNVKDAIADLNSLNLSQYGAGTKIDLKALPSGKLKFNIATNFGKLKKDKKKDAFKLSVLPIIEALYQIILEKETGPRALGSLLKSGFFKGGKQAVMELFDNDLKKRAILCAAIFAVVPGVLYALYYLTENAEEVNAALKEDFNKIGKAFGRRLELFWPVTLPVADILKQLKESIIQIGLNLARDLVINIILHLLEELKEACADEEDAGAPYSPLGQIDLSEFIVASATKNNTQISAGALENAPGTQMILENGGITLDQFRTVLSALSAGLTIREMCQLLDNGASENLYFKAAGLLEEVAGLENTPFYVVYANLDGIKSFFKTISKDIDPQYCIIARQTFEKEKRLLLNLCGGVPDDVQMANLMDFLDEESALKRLANNQAYHQGLVGRALDTIQTIFKGPIEMDPFCNKGGSGISTYHESQAHTTNMVGDSIFKAIEDAFENDIRRIKYIYSDSKKRLEMLKNMTFPKNDETWAASSALEGLEDTDQKSDTQKLLIATNDPTLPASSLDEFEQLSAVNKAYDKDYVANGIRANLIGDLAKNNFKYDAAKGDVSLGYEGPNNRNVRMEYNYLTNVTTLSYWAVSLEDETIPIYSHTSHSPGIPFLFNEVWKEHSGLPPGLQTAFYQWLPQAYPTYNTLLNGVFESLLSYSAHNGLYRKVFFKHLSLNKRIPAFDSEENCLLGFFNKRVLNLQTQKLIDSLACFTETGSVSKNSTNLSFVKMLVDCLIRVIVVKETMKTLFTFGTFSTEELKKDSFFWEVMVKELEVAVKKHFMLTSGNINKFYDEVVGEFITGIMRVLYQDESLDDKKALELSISAQIAFVKTQLYKAINRITPLKTAQLEGALRAFEVVETAEGADGADFNTLSMKAKTITITNDGLVDYLNPTPSPADETPPLPDDLTPYGWAAEGPTVDYTPWMKEVALTQIDFYRTTPEDAPEHTSDPPLPVITRMRKNEFLPTFLKGNDTGLVDERWVEIKYNQQFYENLRNTPTSVEGETRLDVIKEALIGLAACFNIIPHENSNSHGFGIEHLKNFLNETKLILWFPQIFSLLQEENWAHVSKYYGSTILWDLFQYNFNHSGGSDYAPFDKAKIYTNTNYRTDLSHAFSGKIYLSDFLQLTRQFLEPYVLKRAQDLWNKEKHPSSHKDFMRLGIDHPLMPSILPRSYESRDGNLSWANRMMNHMSDQVNDNKDAAQLYEVADQDRVFALINKNKKHWLMNDYENGLATAKNFQTNNFFSWLVLQEATDILGMDFGANITQYIAAQDIFGTAVNKHELEERGVQWFGAFEDGPSWKVPSAQKLAAIDEMIKNKVGKIALGDPNFVTQVARTKFVVDPTTGKLKAVPYIRDINASDAEWIKNIHNLGKVNYYIASTLFTAHSRQPSGLTWFDYLSNIRRNRGVWKYLASTVSHDIKGGESTGGSSSGTWTFEVEGPTVGNLDSSVGQFPFGDPDAKTAGGPSPDLFSVIRRFLPEIVQFDPNKGHPQYTDPMGDNYVDPGEFRNRSLEMFINFMTEPQQEAFNKLTESLFLEEQTTIISLIHRMLAQKHYSEIDACFNHSINTITSALMAAIAVANGDYKKTAPVNNPRNFMSPTLDFDLGDLGEELLKMVLGGLASMVDPTWTTKWFMPGPFTPIGVAAKLVFEDPLGLFDDDPNAKKPRKTCDAAIDAQVSEMDLGPFFNKEE